MFMKFVLQMAIETLHVMITMIEGYCGIMYTYT